MNVILNKESPSRRSDASPPPFAFACCFDLPPMSFSWKTGVGLEASTKAQGLNMTTHHQIICDRLLLRGSRCYCVGLRWFWGRGRRCRLGLCRFWGWGWGCCLGLHWFWSRCRCCCLRLRWFWGWCRCHCLVLCRLRGCGFLGFLLGTAAQNQSEYQHNCQHCGE